LFLQIKRIKSATGAMQTLNGVLNIKYFFNRNTNIDADLLKIVIVTARFFVILFLIILSLIS